jgi:hypothetical protein
LAAAEAVVEAAGPVGRAGRAAVLLERRLPRLSRAALERARVAGRAVGPVAAVALPHRS